MKRFILCLFAILLLALSAEASTVVTATIAVTNIAGTTNGQTFTLNGDTRTFTNSIFTPATQLYTNNTQAGVAANMLTILGLNNYPFTGIASVGQSATTNVTLKANQDTAITVTVSAGWAVVTYVTNTIGSAVGVRIPYTIESAAEQTNIASGLAAAIASSADTNSGLISALLSVSHSSWVNTNDATHNWAIITNGGFFMTNAMTGDWLNLTNDSITISNAITGLSAVLTNGGATFGSNVVAANFYGTFNGSIGSALFVTGNQLALTNSFNSTNNTSHYSLTFTNDTTHNWGIFTNGGFFITNAVTGNWLNLTNDSLQISNRATGLSATLTNGGANFQSNVVANQFFGQTTTTNLSTDFSTNTITTGNGTATMDMSKTYSLLATNANITISLANVPTVTDRPSILILTNTGANASTILITLSGFSCLTNGVPTQTFWVTNLTAKNQVTYLSVNSYAGRLTNAVATAFYNP